MATIIPSDLSELALAGVLSALGMRDFTEITQQIPALQLNTWSPNLTIFNIRGISQNSFTDNLEGPIAVYHDDAYVASMNGISGQLFDMERVVAGLNPADETERAELRQFLEQTIDGADSFDDRFDAEVWLVDMSGRLARFVKDPQERLHLLREIHAAASRAAGTRNGEHDT